MSTAIHKPHRSAGEVRKDKSKKKDKSEPRSKDKSEKKASKKRRHENVDSSIQKPNGALEFSVQVPESPAKRQRTETSVPPSSSCSILVPDSQLPPLDDLESPFFCTTASIRVYVPPVAQKYPCEGVCANYLSPQLLTYHSKFKGIILGYNNAKLSSSPPPSKTSDSPQKGDSSEDDEDHEVFAQAFEQYAAPFIWVTAQFLVLKLRKGMILEGNINLQNETNIGLVLWNVFSVTIEEKRIPSKWHWVETDDSATDGYPTKLDLHDQEMRRQNEVWGNWENEKGKPVEGMIRFTVRDFDVTLADRPGEQSVLSIEGTLLSEEEEKKVDREEEEAAAKVRKALEEERKANDWSGSRSSTPGVTSPLIRSTSTARSRR